MANKWIKQLQKNDAAVVGELNPFLKVIRSPSPSFNFIFGGSHGIPQGYSLVLFGPPKGGKSVITNSMIGQLHLDDPEAIVVKYNSEFRERVQVTPATMKLWHMDPDRYVAYEMNNSVEVFDMIEGELAAKCQEGMPLKLVIIDSVSSLVGRRTLNTTSLGQQTIGDLALTIQEGLKRILPVQRKFGFSVILTCQVRAEMDQTEQMRGNKVKMAASYGLQHYGEYFVFVEPNRNKDGRKDLAGNDLKDEELKDLQGNAEQTGHKIRLKMKDSSLGPKGRVGEFTFSAKDGIINVHEEVFLLGKARGIFERPNNRTYVLDGQQWTSEDAMVEALRRDLSLQQKVIGKIKLADSKGLYLPADEIVELEAAAELKAGAEA